MEIYKLSVWRHHPFGMAMPGRSLSLSNYRFGFNGKEKDDEARGVNNSLDFGARMYDPRLGRWLSRDPDEKRYPSWSTYNSFVDNPIYSIDDEGKGARATKEYDNNGKLSAIRVTSTIYIYSHVVEQEELCNIGSRIEANIEASYNTVYSEKPDGTLKGDVPTARVNGENIPLVYDVTIEAVDVNTAQALAMKNKSKGAMDVNFIEINNGEESYFDGNSGAIDLNRLDERGNTTDAHEFGHLLGFRFFRDHPESSFAGVDDNTHSSVQEGKSYQSIMAQDKPLSLSQAKSRKVLQSDTDKFNLGKGIGNVSFSARKHSGVFGEKPNNLVNTMPKSQK